MNTQEQDEDLAFEAAFNATNAEHAEHVDSTPAVDRADPPADAAPATAPAVATQDEKEEPVVDPFAGLPPQVRELLARVPALEARLEQTTRVANMVPALQSRLDKMNQPPAATEQVPERGRFAKVEAIRAELPEIADALDEIASDRHREPVPPQAPAQAQPATVNPHEEALSSVRPQWADDLVSSDFQLWLAQQPREYQAVVVNTSKAGEILHALGQFDSYRAQTNSTRQLNQTRSTRMAAAVTPQGDGRRQRVVAAPEDEEEAAFSAAFNKQRGR